MNSNNFRRQIDEDINLIQAEYVTNNPKLLKYDYCFNYWVLAKLYNIDEEIIEDNITEYSDDGCDCYVYFEESKELYIIQNKYYTTTKVDRNYVIKDFLYRPLNTLEQNNYRRSKKLQEIFNKNKKDPDFKIYLNFYVTNNLFDEKLLDTFKSFKYASNEIKCYIEANIYYLEDIKNLYFEDRKKDIKTFECTFLTKNDGTVLNIDKQAYKLPNLIDAKYILTPIKQIYEIVDSAYKQNYMLFEENIREYLGKKGVNARMANTLEDPDDRDNFFYYNNGITVICDRVQKESIISGNFSKGFKTVNPQIVNGCQTVNTIYEVLKKYPENELIENFENTFVMVKVLVLDKTNEENIALYQDIVRYNNSQNAISDKDFAQNKKIFKNLQKEFKNYGLLLAVKQSDKNSFKEKESFNTYRPKLQNYTDMFGLEFNKLEDIIIPLEKLLQIILAFSIDGYNAFTKKSQLAKVASSTYNHVLEFIKSGKLTNKDIINLYMLFLKSEKEKKNSEDQRTPIPYYVIGFIGNEFKNINDDEYREKYKFLFKDSETFNTIYNFYKNVTKRYKLNYYKEKQIEYNQMIKSAIDYILLQNIINDEILMLENSHDKNIIKNFRNSKVSENVNELVYQ